MHLEGTLSNKRFLCKSWAFKKNTCFGKHFIFWNTQLLFSNFFPMIQSEYLPHVTIKNSKKFSLCWRFKFGNIRVGHSLNSNLWLHLGVGICIENTPLWTHYPTHSIYHPKPWCHGIASTLPIMCKVTPLEWGVT